MLGGASDVISSFLLKMKKLKCCYQEKYESFLIHIFLESIMTIMIFGLVLLALNPYNYSP